MCGDGGEEGRGAGLPGRPPSRLSCSGLVKSGEKRKLEKKEVCVGQAELGAGALYFLSRSARELARSVPRGCRRRARGAVLTHWGSSLGSRDPQTEPSDPPRPRLTYRHRGGPSGPLRLFRCLFTLGTPEGSSRGGLLGVWLRPVQRDSSASHIPQGPWGSSLTPLSGRVGRSQEAERLVDHPDAW